MRALDLLGLMLLALLGSYASFRLVGAAAARRRLAAARWLPYHRSAGGSTQVGVRRQTGWIGPAPSYDERVVATIADEDASYDDLFQEAMWTAQRRAATLELSRQDPL